MNQTADPFADIKAAKSPQGSPATGVMPVSTPAPVAASAQPDPFADIKPPKPLDPSRFAPLISQAESKYGLPPSLLHAQLKAESDYNPSEVNAKSGAAGIAQFTPETAKQFGIDPMNPGQSIDAAGKYMRQLIDQFGGSVPNALAAYNAGPGNVHKYGGIPPFKETQNYVSKIMGQLRQQSALYNFEGAKADPNVQVQVTPPSGPLGATSGGTSAWNALMGEKPDSADAVARAERDYARGSQHAGTAITGAIGKAAPYLDPAETFGFHPLRTWLGNEIPALKPVTDFASTVGQHVTSVAPYLVPVLGQVGMAGQAMELGGAAAQQGIPKTAAQVWAGANPAGENLSPGERVARGLELGLGALGAYHGAKMLGGLIPDPGAGLGEMAANSSSGSGLDMQTPLTPEEHLNAYLGLKPGEATDTGRSDSRGKPVLRVKAEGGAAATPPRPPLPPAETAGTPGTGSVPPSEGPTATPGIMPDAVYEALHNHVAKTGELPPAHQGENGGSLLNQVYEAMVAHGDPRGGDTLDSAIDMVHRGGNSAAEVGKLWQAERTPSPTAEPEPPGTRVNVNGKTFELTGAAEQAYLQEKDGHDRFVQNRLSQESPDDPDIQAQLKGAGMGHSAFLRDLVGEHTPKEAKLQEQQANKLTPGMDATDPDGNPAKVKSNAFGKVTLQYEDGSTTTYPRSDVNPAKPGRIGAMEGVREITGSEPAETPTPPTFTDTPHVPEGAILGTLADEATGKTGGGIPAANTGLATEGTPGMGGGTPVTDTPAPVTDIPETVGARKSETSASAAAHGIDLADIPKQPTIQAGHDAGKAAVDSGKIDPLQLAKAVNGKPRQITPEEIGALQQGHVHSINDVQSLLGKIKGLQDAGENHEMASALLRTKLEEGASIRDALRKGGSQNSAALNAMKMMSVLDDGTYAGALSTARAVKGSALTSEEIGKIDLLHKKIADTEGKLQKEQDAHADTRAQLIAARDQAEAARVAAAQARATRGTARTTAKKTLDDEFEDLRGQLAKARSTGKRGGPESGMAHIPADQAAILAKMVRNRVARGAVSAAQAIEYVYNAARDHIDGLTLRHVRDAYTLYGAEPRPVGEAARVTSLGKRIETEKSKMEDVAAGIPPPKRTGPIGPTSPKVQALQDELNNLRAQRIQLVNSMAKPSALDIALKVNRMARLSGFSIFGKIMATSMAYPLLTPVEDLFGSALRVVPRYAQEAPTETMFNPKAYAQGTKDFFKSVVDGDLVRSFKTGINKLGAEAAIRGEQGGGMALHEAPSVLNLFQRVHTALHTPLQRYAYTVEASKLTDLYAKKGVNVSDPEVVADIGAKAYAKSLEAALMNDNHLSTAINDTFKSLDRSGTPVGRGLAAVGRFEVPFARVGSNMAGRRLEYLGAGAVRDVLGQAFKGLAPEDAAASVRAWKRAGIGAGVTALGYYLARQGALRGPGLYDPLTPGKGQRDGDLHAGQMSIGDHKVFDSAMESPIFGLLNLGLSMADAEKHGHGLKAAGDVAARTVQDLTERTPALGVVSEFPHLGDRGASGWLGRQVPVPAGLGDAARILDQKPGTHVDSAEDLVSLLQGRHNVQRQTPGLLGVPQSEIPWLRGKLPVKN